MAATTELSAFCEIEGAPATFVAYRGNLSCTAFRLNDGSVGLFNPAQGQGAAAVESLKSIGPVSWLIAPNHYHNKALAEYQRAYPQARLCASRKAIPRLQQVTGFQFDDLSEVVQKLPRAYSLVQPDGLKTGEIWLRLKCELSTVWFVVDAISGAKRSKSNDYCGAPEMLETFPRYGLSDTEKFIAWVERQLGEEGRGSARLRRRASCAGDPLWDR